VAEDEPARVTPPARLTAHERRLVAMAAGAPILLAAIVLVPIALLTGASAGEVVAASLVYGGLVGLAAGFVTVDRMQARQCLRCRERTAGRGAERCTACGYDLVERPRYACDERHGVFLEPGLCACGRRLKPLPTTRGVGREVRFVLKLGAWLLAFLIGVGLLLQLLDRNL
jgi:hypothetical protein